MKNFVAREFKFYICILLGYSLLVIGCFCPPIGIVSNSVLVAAGMFICLAGLIIGLDLPAVIREIRLLKKEIKDDILSENENENENNND